MTVKVTIKNVHVLPKIIWGDTGPAQTDSRWLQRAEEAGLISRSEREADFTLRTSHSGPSPRGEGLRLGAVHPYGSGSPVDVCSGTEPQVLGTMRCLHI